MTRHERVLYTLLCVHFGLYIVMIAAFVAHLCGLL